SGLAKYSLCKNIKVTGSDKNENESIVELRGLGAKISIPESNLNEIRPDLIVCSSAIAEDNIELLSAKKLKIPIYKRSEFLGEIIKKYKKSICVCGCHGKTTVTAMLTHIFMREKSVPTSFIGGIDKQFKNFFYGEDDLIVAEACEYKKNFLDLSPKTIVCTNVDFDHVDSYTGIKDTINTFEKFMENKQTVINADDKYSASLLKKCAISYGITKGNIRATKIIPTLYGNSFSVLYNGQDLGRLEINLKGIFNIYNALSAIACAILHKVDFQIIKEALSEFMGVERRMEYLGTYNNLLFFADYAHHPKEINETINAFCNKKTIIVFQPHTYSRTKIFMEDFIKSLMIPKKVII
ncbi:MAG: UDP-N-acetylmuramate--L-alanine ligase, partial [Firmicutes bacterium]|nr:UDP-N-acetylmuramate--L-alanine ligase [Candidatus Caballimonas caccae]